MTRLTTVTLAAALMATTATASDYPFSVQSFLCGDGHITIVKDASGDLSIADAWADDLTVQRIEDGFLIQHTFMYDDTIPMPLQNFLKQNDSGDWKITSIKGDKVHKADCDNISRVAADLLPVLEEQLAAGGQTQSDRIAQLEAALTQKTKETEAAIHQNNKENFTRIQELESHHRNQVRELRTEHRLTVEAMEKEHTKAAEWQSKLRIVCDQVKLRANEGVQFNEATLGFCEAG